MVELVDPAGLRLPLPGLLNDVIGLENTKRKRQLLDGIVSGAIGQSFVIVVPEVSAEADVYYAVAVVADAVGSLAREEGQEVIVFVIGTIHRLVPVARPFHHGVVLATGVPRHQVPLLHQIPPHMRH